MSEGGTFTFTIMSDKVASQNLTVVVDTAESDPMVWVGPNFVNKYFPDAVYTTAPAGAAEPLRLYGRVSPEMLADPAKAKKKPEK